MSTIHHFTDSEYAVIYDALTMARDRIDGPTPNIDSALEKLGAWADPTGCEFIAVTGVDMWLLLGAANHPAYDERRYLEAMRKADT